MACDQSIIDRQGLLTQIHLLLVLILFYLQVSTPHKYDKCSPAECLRTTTFHRHSSPETLVQIRVIMRYLDHLLVTRPENSRQTIQRIELGAIAGARESPQKQTRHKHTKKGYTLQQLHTK